jgi:phage shock protein A
VASRLALIELPVDNRRGKKLPRGLGRNDPTCLVDMFLIALFPFILEYPMLFGIGFVVAVFAILTATNQTAIGRFGRSLVSMVLGWFGAGATQMKNVNPIQQRANAIREKQAKIAKGESGLANFDAKRRENKRLLDNAKQDVERLQRRTQLAVDEKRQQDAREHALELLEARKQLNALQAEEDAFAKEYEEHLDMIDDANKLVRTQAKQTEVMATRLEMAETRATVAQIAASANPNNMSSADDALREADAVINDKIDQAEAKAKVTHDLNRSYFDEKAENERIAAQEADALLSEFSKSADASTGH